MNVFHMNYRSLRSLSIMLAVVVCVYVVMNIVYISLSDSLLTENSESTSNVESLAARLKFGKPDANGKVEVVLSLDAEQLAKLLGNSDLSGLYSGGNKQRVAEVAENQILINNGSSRPPLNVSYVLYNPTLCDGLASSSGLSWVVGIHTTPEQSDRRKLLRETWANVSLFRQNVFQRFFVMGRASDGQESIQAEFEQYRDIVQGDFVDVTRNATLKGLLALRYVARHCTNAKYYIKSNDDTFLDIFSMMQMFESAAAYQATVICPLWKDNTMPILRKPADCMQWCVADDELPGRTHFPQYCASVAFALSRELVSALYTASLLTPYFWIDDVYITGLLMPEVSKKFHGIHYVDLLSNFTLVEKDIDTEYQDSTKSRHFTMAKIRDADIYRRVWKAVFSHLTPSQFKMLSDAAIAQYT